MLPQDAEGWRSPKQCWFSERSQWQVAAGITTETITITDFVLFSPAFLPSPRCYQANFPAVPKGGAINHPCNDPAAPQVSPAPVNSQVLPNGPDEVAGAVVPDALLSPGVCCPLQLLIPALQGVGREKNRSGFHLKLGRSGG